MPKLDPMVILNISEPIYLRDQIKVNQSYARSVNVEYDLNNIGILENYLLTPQVIQSFSRM